MRFEDLKIGKIFVIDGKGYEAYHVGQRIVLAYALRPQMTRETSATLQRIKLPTGEPVRDAFSDLRFERNNLTDFERQCDEDLKNLL